MKNHVWVSFDLGVRGDFEGMYTWLDNHKAKECGDSAAFVQFESAKDIVKELQKSLKDAISINNKSRIYIIYRSPAGKLVGKYIFGGRKLPPWKGFASLDSAEDTPDEA